MLSSRLGRSSSARRWLLLSVRSATSSSVTTAAATATTGRFTLASWQKNCWDSYLATGRGSDDLFQSIDSDQTKKISKQELDVFLQSVNYKGVHPRAFKMLDELASDHEITLREFKSWLVLATKFGAFKNSQLQTFYESHPNTGQLSPTKQQHQHEKYTWNEVTMSQSVRRMQYAVRGQVVMRADELQAQGREILFTNVGNPQAVGQPPITYYRQVMALADLPPSLGINHACSSMFPLDVVERARHFHDSNYNTGAYTSSQGILEFRKHVADYIVARDGHPAYAGNIFLTNGASSAIDHVLTTLMAGDRDAVMIPIPQYPIYSALIARLGGRQVGYLLDEERGWSISLDELERKRDEASMDDDLEIKALVIINPGNPTGQVWGRKDLEIICKFCAEHGIVLLADEVYQRNVYADDKEFVSAKRVALETPSCEDLQLVSFHSTSKGLIGECGRRGGYMELHNIDPYVQSQLYKLASSGLCSNVAGQLMTSLMVKPPQPGDESFEQFFNEESEIYQGLKRRAAALVQGLNSIAGMDCQAAEGAMYAFPRLTSLPTKALQEAERLDCTPDTLYALSLLEATGICVVPASGFGQKEGRVGFRTTFLPPDDKLLKAIDQFAHHHKEFCDKYS